MAARLLRELQSPLQGKMPRQDAASGRDAAWEPQHQQAARGNAAQARLLPPMAAWPHHGAAATPAHQACSRNPLVRVTLCSSQHVQVTTWPHGLTVNNPQQPVVGQPVTYSTQGCDGSTATSAVHAGHRASQCKPQHPMQTSTCVADNP